MKTVFVRSLKFGPALLLLAYVNCKGGEKTEPAVASTIAPNSPATISAVAGAAVTPPPSVIVRDQNGNPFAGAPVTFNVISGGGTITGAASATTDASGLAAVGGWTLGTTAGPNVLQATSGSLTASFTATGTPGPPATMTVSTGDNQVGFAGAALPTNPAVVVKDANGNLVSGVTVTFTVGSGGGSVTAPTATTNAAGIAAVGSWTLGANSGTNTLIASANGVPAVTFHAIAASAKCGARTPHVLGTSTVGTLETNDCQFSDGSFVDFFSTTLPEANAYLFRQTATFDTYLDLELADGSVIAENDDEDDNTSNSGIKALLPPGNYLLGAGSFLPGITGNYTVTSQTTSPNNGNCELVFVVKNVSTTQSLAVTDCLWTTPPAAPIYADAFFILLRAGQSVTINMSSSTMDSYLELIRSSGVRVAQNDNKDASTLDAQIVFTATTTDYYGIFPRTAVASQTGVYTLSIQ